MSDISKHCQELLDEYRILRRRLEEDEFTNPDLDDAPTNEDEQADRLEELKEELEDNCDLELPEEDDADIDLPDHAGGTPSEPMDFDAE
jgi:hypothetical protein